MKGCPFHIRAMPEVSAITYTGMEPCAVGSIVEVLVGCEFYILLLVLVTHTNNYNYFYPIYSTLFMH